MRKSKFPGPGLYLEKQLSVIDLGHNEPTIVETPTVQLTWPDEDATLAFAQHLAANPALRNAFVALRGNLGAGKTTLVRHLLRALGVQGRIKSPTYAVVEPYTLTGAEQNFPLAGTPEDFNIWHFDFYRFTDPREWTDAGFRDIFASPGLKLAEWPQNAGDHLPQADLVIELATQQNETRDVQLTARTETGHHLVVGLLADSLADPSVDPSAGPAASRYVSPLP